MESNLSLRAWLAHLSGIPCDAVLHSPPSERFARLQPLWGNDWTTALPHLWLWPLAHRDREAKERSPLHHVLLRLLAMLRDGSEFHLEWKRRSARAAGDRPGRLEHLGVPVETCSSRRGMHRSATNTNSTWIRTGGRTLSEECSASSRTCAPMANPEVDIRQCLA
jgi:hypothetical protein